MSEEIPQEQNHGSTHLFQITEPDLAELERLLPKICDRAIWSGADGRTDPGMRVAIISVQQIVSRIRWDYGPPQEVYRVPA